MPHRRRSLRLTLAALALAAPVAAAQAACPSDEAVGRLADALLASRPTEGFGPGLTLADGQCAQDKLVALLQRHWGQPVGYKVGLTAQPMQQRFGVPHPVRGVLFESAVRLNSGAEVPARFGALPVVEADFLVRVRDDGINTAGADHVAILRHLDAVIPFIELADLVLSGGFDGPNLLAINVGARLGVVGAPIEVEAAAAFAQRLAAMTVTLTDDTGRELARSPGTAVLGHPLNAVAFLVQDLAKGGRRLQAGDLLSIAGFSPALPAEAGRTYTVRYEGLRADGAPATVSVRLR